VKKASTYYFLLFAAANGFAAYVIPSFNSMVTKTLVRQGSGRWCPPLARLFLSTPWWPHVFVVLFLTGAVLSLATRWLSETLCHAVIVLLAVEAFVLFFGMVGYVLPFLTIVSNLSEH
jgi:hypothetical protein